MQTIDFFIDSSGIAPGLWQNSQVSASFGKLLVCEMNKKNVFPYISEEIWPKEHTVFLDPEQPCPSGWLGQWTFTNRAYWNPGLVCETGDLQMQQSTHVCISHVVVFSFPTQGIMAL